MHATDEPNRKNVKIALFASLLALSFQTTAEQGDAFRCSVALDAAVTLASNPDADTASLDARFKQLETHCPQSAQLAHNRGVLAANEAQWPQAIAHFKRSLALDNRAADTHRHLQQIFEYRAASAYAQALGTPLKAQAPQMTFQDSGMSNPVAPEHALEDTGLRDMATIEYELYAWWQAQRDWTGVRSHYVDGYEVEAIKLSRAENSDRSWEDTQREIAFTREDVAVVLSDAERSHTLLLMRLVGSRWKIYQETRL